MTPRITIRFDPQSSVPAIRQISDNLRVVLVEQRLKAGTQLPSIRRLAMELGVHFSTVAEAYRELAAEGWLELVHGRGALVLERSIPAIPRKNWIDRFQDRLRGLMAETLAEGASRNELAAELQAAARGVTR